MEIDVHSSLILDNYRRCFGDDLVVRGRGEVVALMKARFVVLSHGTQADPIFNYGNDAALALFEMDWATLTALPSRCSAEPMHRAERERLLCEVQKQGYSDAYGGVRVSASGRRFRITGARIWMLLDAAGMTVGQAATFSQWGLLDK
jgi:hypothetical protein